jgi:hypothetical protein
MMCNVYNLTLNCINDTQKGMLNRTLFGKKGYYVEIKSYSVYNMCIHNIYVLIYEKYIIEN